MTNRTLLFAIPIFILYPIGLNATYNYECGSRFSGMANSGVAVPDLWSMSHNQAGMAGIKNVMGGVNYESKYLVNELGLSSFTLAIPKDEAVVGMQLNYFGYTKYHETKLGFAVAKSFNDKFAAGIQIDYFNTFVYGLEAYNRLTFEGGILARASDNVKIGFSFFNPLPEKTKINSLDPLPTIVRFGTAYSYESKGLITAEIEKDLEQDIVLKTGLEYNVNDDFSLRTGVSSGESLFSFGMGYKIEKLRIDMAFVLHQVLGFTPSFTLTYALK